MQAEIVPLLLCPRCSNRSLIVETYSRDRSGEVKDGVVFCRKCPAWYPVEDFILELLTGELAYRKDRENFIKKFKKRLRGKSLKDVAAKALNHNRLPQKSQQKHFDWYAANHQQSYTAYAATSFWRCQDKLVFNQWRPLISDNAWLLDVGCAQGRSTFALSDLPINIMAFDISKDMIREAVKIQKMRKLKAKVTFFVADAANFPVASSAIDYALLYGVLHHLPNPKHTCREISRVLKPKTGIYFGLENNKTPLRTVFDFMQNVRPLWFEHAGRHPVMSKKDLTRWFGGTPMSLVIKPSIFIPPHLVNLLPLSLGYRLIAVSDIIGSHVAFLNYYSGLISIIGRKN